MIEQKKHRFKKWMIAHERKVMVGIIAVLILSAVACFKGLL